MTYLTYDVKEYFNEIIPLQDKSILDWGCNHANFLKYAPHTKYTGVDIINPILESNKKQWPEHTWIHYDQYNPQYNCNLNAGGKWPKLEKFDVIIAFSVFTHTSENEMVETVSKLKRHVNNNGNILITYFSLDTPKDFSKVVSYREDLFGDIEHIYDGVRNDNTISLCASHDSSFLLKNMRTLPKIEREMYTLTFYRDDYIAHILGGEIVSLPQFSGIRGVQKCIKI